MIKFTMALMALVCCGSVWGQAQKPDYPLAKKSDVSDDFFGTTVADPYRWMEDESAPERAEWIAAENALTRRVIDAFGTRDALKSELTARYDYEKNSLPVKRGDRYFFFRNSGLKNQAVLYVTDDLAKEPRVLLDPNTLAADGTAALGAWAVSRDGRYLAYTIAQSGSDWQEGFVLDIQSGETLPEKLRWIKFSDLAWAGDGFYYSRYPAPEPGKELSAKNEFHQVWFHRVGTEQSADTLIYMNKEQPQRNVLAITDEDEQWLFVAESESTYGNTLAFRPLTNGANNVANTAANNDANNAADTKSDSADEPFTTIFPTFEAETFPVTVHDGKFLLLTDYRASKKRLVEVDPASPTPEHWRDILPEAEDLLADVTPTADRLVATYLKDAAHESAFYDYNGKMLERLELPTLGVASFSGHKDDPELFWSFTSFVYPAVIYRYDNALKKSSPLFESKSNFSPDDYVTERLFYTSTDSTKAPIFITYKKGIQRDGTNPTLLYGYGGFNINMTPSFNPGRTVWLDHGGVYAVAVLRGGGEYGEAWHKAGTKLFKQNVFDDFLAAAEFLIAENYTAPKHLAIHGGSNGGLLVGAAMTQRPDLFAAAVPAVGVLDMLRYHLFTIGWAWAADYGTSADSKEMFDALYAYSPLHHIKPGVNYPATLIMTSDHDDRVVPAHSLKFAATLQEADGGKNPILIRIETKAGHGSGKPLAKQLDEAADMYAFLLHYCKGN